MALYADSGLYYTATSTVSNTGTYTILAGDLDNDVETVTVRPSGSWRKDTALDWLDKRVEEMRVKL